MRALLSELPADRWHTWQPRLPAPRAFVDPDRRSVVGLQPVGKIARRGVFGTGCPILAADGRGAGRPRRSGGRSRGIGRRRLAAEHRQDRHLGCRVPASPGAGGRLRACEPDESDPVAPRSVRVGRRRRCCAAPPGRRHHAARTRRSPLPSMPSPGERCDGAWASAASALVEASRMSVDRTEHEERLLRAIDAIVSAGDLLQASAFTRHREFEPGPLRDAALGYLAILRGRVTEAEGFLTTGWERADAAATRISRRCWRCGGRCIRSGDSAERRSSSGAVAPCRSSRTTTRYGSRPMPSADSGSGSWAGCPTGWRPTRPCSRR